MIDCEINVVLSKIMSKLGRREKELKMKTPGKTQSTYPCTLHSEEERESPGSLSEWQASAFPTPKHCMQTAQCTLNTAHSTDMELDFFTNPIQL